jgi:hypothetical protein
MKESIDLLEEEKLSSREKLLAFEKENRFVFHGSPDEIKILEPRQPLVFNVQKKKREKHGEPCVAATPYADIAIFRAIINQKNYPTGDYVSFFKVSKEGLMEFGTTKQVLERIKEKKGFVYVLNKEAFKRFSNSNMEWRASEAIKPEDVFLVTAEDLPSNIQIVDKDFNPIVEDNK